MEVSIVSNPTRVWYFILGTRQEVEDEINRLLGSYHTVGYGTHVKACNFEDPRAKTAVALVERTTSCD